MDATSSLLAPEQQQPLFDESQLPLGSELLLIEQNVKMGRYTGERIARDRARYAAIIRGLAEGFGVRQLARAFGVAPRTIDAIRRREGLAISTEKKEVSDLMGLFVRLGTERLVDEVNDIPIGQLSVSVGIVSDKKALLDGDPTVRIADARGEPTVEELVDRFERLRQVKVIDVPDELAGGPVSQAGPAAGPPAAVVAAPAAASPDVWTGQEPAESQQKEES